MTAPSSEPAPTPEDGTDIPSAVLAKWVKSLRLSEAATAGRGVPSLNTVSSLLKGMKVELVEIIQNRGDGALLAPEDAPDYEGSKAIHIPGVTERPYPEA